VSTDASNTDDASSSSFERVYDAVYDNPAANRRRTLNSNP
jgi:hypothetical protein